MGEKNDQRIVVLGAGWLGLPLANYMKNKGYQVTATCRTQINQSALAEQGLDARIFCLGDDSKLLTTSHPATCFVINIPFGKQGKEKTLFEYRMKTLFSSLLQNNQNRLLFISTTSVYGDQQGVVDELSQVSPVTESAKVHVALEDYLKESWPQQTSIARLSGLVGGTRHPIHSLAKKGRVKQSNWPVNLVHRDDVIHACEEIIVQGAWGHTFVFNALAHPTKDEYYRWAADQCGLVCPEMQADSKGNGKVVDGRASWKALGIEPCYPTPYDML